VQHVPRENKTIKKDDVGVMMYWVKTDESSEYGIVKWLHSRVSSAMLNVQCNRLIIKTTTTHSFATATHILWAVPLPNL
jgi:hypothetical protein